MGTSVKTILFVLCWMCFEKPEQYIFIFNISHHGGDVGHCYPSSWKTVGRSSPIVNGYNCWWPCIGMNQNINNHGIARVLHNVLASASEGLSNTFVTPKNANIFAHGRYWISTYSKHCHKYANVCRMFWQVYFLPVTDARWGIFTESVPVINQ